MQSKIICGDVFDVIDDHCNNDLDVVYIDPPFNTGKKMCGSDGNFYTDSLGFDYYLDFIKDVVINIYEKCLNNESTMFIHLDYRMSHYVKCEVMDYVFGRSNFLNEIIWKYGLGGSRSKYFPRKHDTILWYKKGKDYFFNPIMTDCTSTMLKGKKKKLGDVWEYTLSNNAPERVGYPTQKPLRILENIIYSSLRPGGTIGDFFCGSGTTGVAALESGNSFIVSDRKEEAIKVAEERIKECKNFEKYQNNIEVVS